MQTSVVWGSLCFGAVIGWITYHTLRRNARQRTLSDVMVVLAALVGPAILTVFPAPSADTRQTMFGYYGIGLACGFFLYYILFLVLAWTAPAEVLLSMGLVQECEVEREGASGDGALGERPPDPSTMDQGSDEPSLGVR